MSMLSADAMSTFLLARLLLSHHPRFHGRHCDCESYDGHDDENHVDVHVHVYKRGRERRKSHQSMSLWGFFLVCVCDHGERWMQCRCESLFDRARRTISGSMVA